MVSVRQLTGALFILSLSMSATHAALGPSVVVDWLNRAQTLVRTYGIPNQLAGRYYGLLGLSIHRALQYAEVANDTSANQTAIAAVAAHAILDTFFPWTYAQNDILIASQLGDISPTELATAKKYGQAAAAFVAGQRIADGYATWSNFKPYPANAPSSYGKYQFTDGEVVAVYPQLGDTTPLVLSKTDINNLAAPLIANHSNYIFSDDYYRELAYVAQIGGKNSTSRTAYDNDTPGFWADGGSTSSIGGHLINVTYQVLPSSYTLKQQARFYARLGAALADASIATWKVKYNVLQWRPVTAIRQPDGSTGRYTPDPTWTPYLSPTPFHPSYTSGHQGTTGAWLAVTLDALGQQPFSDTINPPVIIGSEGGNYAPRNYTSLTTLALEVGQSRVLGGLHFPRDNWDGLNLGIAAAQLVLQKI